VKQKIPLEIDEQEKIIEYLEDLKEKGIVSIYSAVPNNTFTRSWNQKRKQVREGVRKGVPDIIFITREHVVFLEVKRVKGGVLSPEQKMWGKAISDSKDGQYGLCRGFDEAKMFIDKVVGDQATLS